MKNREIRSIVHYYIVDSARVFLCCRGALRPGYQTDFGSSHLPPPKARQISIQVCHPGTG